MDDRKSGVRKRAPHLVFRTAAGKAIAEHLDLLLVLLPAAQRLDLARGDGLVARLAIDARRLGPSASDTRKVSNVM